MGIKYSPKVGQILMCDFQGFKEPEMVKRRPVLVIGTRPTGHGLVTVACLSTKKPEIIQPYHLLLESCHFPPHKFFDGKENWLKADMIYTVSFERLDLIKIGTDAKGRRLYFNQRLGKETMIQVRSCILHGINLGFLGQYL
ncbi:type II toxin-antitoxin system PemK/MazF family toxin [Colwellia sp. MEBiC06753]